MTSSENSTKIRTIADCFEACKLENVEIVLEMLSRHSDWLTISHQGLYLIHVALIQENVAMAFALIDFSSRVGLSIQSLETSEGKTIFELAIMSDNPELLHLFDQHFGVTELTLKVNDDVTNTYDIINVDYCSIPALHFAALHGKLRICQYYLSRFPLSETVQSITLVNRQPLYYAVAGGHLAICQLLLEYGADVNHSDEFRITTKHIACTSRNSNARAIVKLFLQHSCDKDTQSTCLRLATVDDDNHDMVTFLLSISAPYHEGDHLRGCASCFIEGGYALQKANPNTMKDFLALEEHGFDTSQMMINDSSEADSSYRHMFLATSSKIYSFPRGSWDRESDVVMFSIYVGQQRIMSHKSEINTCCSTKCVNKVEEDVILAFIEGSLLVNLSPLALALETAASTVRQTNSLSLFKSILAYISDKNAVFNKVESSRWTLLHTICAQEAKPWTASFVRVLLQQGAHEDALSNAGDSPLLLACAACVSDISEARIAVIEELLIAGADARHVNQQGSVALNYAEGIVVDESKDEMRGKLKTTLCLMLLKASGRTKL